MAPKKNIIKKLFYFVKGLIKWCFGSQSPVTNCNKKLQGKPIVTGSVSDRILSNDKILKFLCFGYDFSEQTFRDVLLMLAKASENRHNFSDPVKDDEVVNLLKQALVKSFQEELSLADTSKIAIGVSGGFDSRCLYGALKKFYNAENIYSYTFGCPGQYDYEFIHKYGPRFLHNHLYFNINYINWDIDSEVARVQRLGIIASYSVMAHVFVILRDKGIDKCRIHGFMGDALSGGARPFGAKGAVIDKWDDAINLFCKKNNRFKFQELFSHYICLEKLLPDEPDLSIPGLDKYDLIDFGLRQYQRIKMTGLKRDAHVIRPFSNLHCISTMLLLNNSSDREKGYFKLLKQEFPDIFPDLIETNITNRIEYAMIVKQRINNQSTQRLVNANKKYGLNYAIPLSQSAHFCEWAAFHNNPSFKEMFLVLLKGIRQRKLFPVKLIDHIFSRFMQGSTAERRVSAAQLAGLINLELNIRAGTIDI